MAGQLPGEHTKRCKNCAHCEWEHKSRKCTKKILSFMGYMPCSCEQFLSDEEEWQERLRRFGPPE